MTHCLPTAWCNHGVKGQFQDRPHRFAHGADAESKVPRINMDYFTFKDDVIVEEGGHEDRSTARISSTCLCMQETMCSSVWDYAVSQKGVGEAWVVKQLADDITTIGVARERIIVKTDQESSMGDVQNALIRERSGYGTALENSSVGDSNTNGRVERAIQDLGGLVRILRSFLERR